MTWVDIAQLTLAACTVITTGLTCIRVCQMWKHRRRL